MPLSELLLLPARFVALLLAVAPGRHHDTDSYAHLVVGGDEVELALELETDSFMADVEALPPEGDDWSGADVEAVRARAEAWVAERWQLALDGADVALAWRGAELLRAFDPLQQAERNVRVVLRFGFAAPRRDAAATLTQRLFEGRELAHRHTLLLERGRAETGGELLQEWRVGRGAPFHFTLPDAAPGAAGRQAARAAARGATGAATTPWLLLFAAALAAAPQPWRARARALAATAAVAALAFAAAHAGWIAPAPWAATAAAALSVGYLALENHHAKALELRGATAALFGVVHGMALAPQLELHAGAAAGATVAFAASAIATALLGGALLGLGLSRLARGRAAVAFAVPWLLAVAAGAGAFFAIRGR